MNCCHNISIYRGDNAPHFITIEKPDNTDDITIKKGVLVISGLPPFVKENPVYPYDISLTREQTQSLMVNNKGKYVIYYNMEIDGEIVEIKTTCEGWFEFDTKPQVLGEAVQNE